MSGKPIYNNCHLLSFVMGFLAYFAALDSYMHGRDVLNVDT